MSTAYDTWLEGNCGINNAAEDRADRVADKAAELLAHDDHLQGIVSDVYQDFMPETHDEAWTLLYRLQGVEPADLLNSQVITDLYRLAKQIHAAANERAKYEAESLVAAEQEQSSREHGEYLADRRAAA